MVMTSSGTKIDLSPFTTTKLLFSLLLIFLDKLEEELEEKTLEEDIWVVPVATTSKLTEILEPTFPKPNWKFSVAMKASPTLKVDWVKPFVLKKGGIIVEFTETGNDNPSSVEYNTAADAERETPFTIFIYKRYLANNIYKNIN